MGQPLNKLSINENANDREMSLPEGKTHRRFPLIRTHKFIIFCGVLMVLALFCLTVISYRYGAAYLNSDSSSEMVLDQYLASHNALLTTEWYYPTELYVLYMQLFLIPLFKVFHDWTLIRACAVFITNAVLCVSYIFMMRQTKIRGNWIAFSALFLLLPMEWWYFYLVSYGIVYTPYLIFLFLYLGLSIKLERKKPSKRVVYSVLLVIYSLLALFGGFGGIRYLVLVLVPMVCTLLVDVFAHDRRDRYTSSLRGHPASLDRRVLRFVKRHGALLCGFVMMALGFAVNQLYLLKIYHVGGVSMQMLDPGNTIGTVLSQALASLLSLLGYAAGDNMFSVNGIRDIIVLVLAIGLFYAVIKRLILDHQARKTRILKPLKEDSRQIFLFFLISILVFLLSQLITSNTADGDPRYFFLSFVFVIPVAAALIDSQATKKRQAALAAVLAVFMLGSCVMWFQPIWSHSLSYAGLSDRLDYIHFLLANDDTYGYATYWNGNISTELSNGQITMVGMDLINTDAGAANIDHETFFPWLTRVDYGKPGYHTGKSFVLLQSDEYAKCENSPLLSGGTVVYHQDGYVIIDFPSDSEVFGFGKFVQPDTSDLSSDLPADKTHTNTVYPYSPGMATAYGTVQGNGSFISDGTGGFVLFGPDAPTQAGAYNFTLHYTVTSGAGNVGIFDVATQAGHTIVQSVPIPAGQTSVTLSGVTFADLSQTFEDRVSVDSNTVIQIDSITVEKVG